MISVKSTIRSRAAESSRTSAVRSTGRLCRSPCYHHPRPFSVRMALSVTRRIEAVTEAERPLTIARTTTACMFPPMPARSRYDSLSYNPQPDTNNSVLPRLSGRHAMLIRDPSYYSSLPTAIHPRYRRRFTSSRYTLKPFARGDSLFYFYLLLFFFFSFLRIRYATNQWLQFSLLMCITIQRLTLCVRRAYPLRTPVRSLHAAACPRATVAAHLL